jgi:Nucleotidyltransferase of unknown function (DUF6036)
MPSQPVEFFTNTALAHGMRRLFEQLEAQLALNQPLNVYVAGGMAVHLYTAGRVTTDVDAEFSQRFAMPPNLLAEVTLENGKQNLIYFDTNYNSNFALMHENYIADAIKVDFGLRHLQIYVLTPLDLAVSKISRFADNDKHDICELVRLGLTSGDEIQERANQALTGYVGNVSIFEFNIRDAVALAKLEEHKRAFLEFPESLAVSQFPALILQYDSLKLLESNGRKQGIVNDQNVEQYRTAFKTKIASAMTSIALPIHGLTQVQRSTGEVKDLDR